MSESGYVVRRSIHIKAPPERVWRELEAEEAMRAWFLPDLDYEPRLGGRVELRGGHDSYTAQFGGHITVFDPPRELTFEWDAIPTGHWSTPTLLTIRLMPLDAGTMVEIIHRGFEWTGRDAGAMHRSFEAGWNIDGLERLRRRVEG